LDGNGLGVLIKSVIYGTTAVIHNSFDAGAVNRVIDEEGITLISVVPVMLQRMLEVRDGQPYPSTLRCVLLGGSSAPSSLLEQCATINLPVAQSYRLTEACSQVTTLTPQDRL
jgi:o-succinylbenzoate---CoA ligase